LGNFVNGQKSCNYLWVNWEIGKGIKSHIIPKSFYEIEPQKNGSIELITNKKGEYSKKVREGIYDKEILIGKGEKFFDKFDNYGFELLISKFSKFEEIRGDANTLIGWNIKNYDYQMIKLFALSIIWRAHISKQSFFF